MSVYILHWRTEEKTFGEGHQWDLLKDIYWVPFVHGVVLVLDRQRPQRKHLCSSLRNGRVKSFSLSEWPYIEKRRGLVWLKTVGFILSLSYLGQ